MPRRRPTQTNASTTDSTEAVTPADAPTAKLVVVNGESFVDVVDEQGERRLPIEDARAEMYRIRQEAYDAADDDTRQQAITDGHAASAHLFAAIQAFHGEGDAA